MPVVRSERAAFSPEEKAARIGRIARALQDGIEIKVIRMRGFTYAEIEQAKPMVVGKNFKPRKALR